ncbi:hypothetical protein [Egbenema bharatensis]|uniref:hypothetical protein n=1 Tax=Egbenema bharatensis TaxID=3463334 RepID=UPI003A847C76
MVSTFNDRACRPEFRLLESDVRSVLEQREILPGMETQIQRWTTQNLSESDQRLLDLLQDAIDSGYVRRIRNFKN